MGKKIRTLTLIQNNGKVLLGLKKRGYGLGKWNGYGGKLKANETIEEAMVRELSEEACLVPKEYEKIAVFNFTNNSEVEVTECHLYQIYAYEGVPTETEEMFPKWFNIEEIPYDEMWPDDSFWLPPILEGRKMKADFYIKDYNEIVDHSIEFVDGF